MDLNFYWNKIKGVLGLSLSIANANFKVRNEGNYLGMFWYLLGPVGMFFTILTMKDVFTTNHVKFFPAYLFLGIIMFNIFRTATSSCVGAIVSNEGYIKSIKVPYESFLITGILIAIYSHILEIFFFLIILIYLGISPLGLFLFYPIIFFFFMIFILGISFFLATLGCYIRDLNNLWGMGLNLLYFITPIFYVLPDSKSLSLLNTFNPIYHFVILTRSLVIYNEAPSLLSVGIILIYSIVSFIIGIYIFERFKSKFAEWV